MDESAPAYELTIYSVFRLIFEFFPRNFTACSKPPDKDNHCKVSCPTTQQRKQDAG